VEGSTPRNALIWQDKSLPLGRGLSAALEN
jgi:hypothetical protein